MTSLIDDESNLFLWDYLTHLYQYPSSDTLLPASYHVTIDHEGRGAFLSGCWDSQFTKFHLA